MTFHKPNTYPIKYEYPPMAFNTIDTNVKAKMVNKELRNDKDASTHIPILSIDDLWNNSVIQTILTRQQNLVRILCII